MITLVAILDQEAVEEAKTLDPAVLGQMIEFAETTPIDSNFYITLAHARDAGDTDLYVGPHHFYNFEFVVVSRWKDEKGDLWVAGHNIQTNVTEMVRNLGEAINA